MKYYLFGIIASLILVAGFVFYKLMNKIRDNVKKSDGTPPDDIYPLW